MNKPTDNKTIIRQHPLLSPLLDLIFKMLFGVPGCEKSLISLLTAVLRPPVPIDDVTIQNPHVAKNMVEEKGIVVDILVRTVDGTHFDVEMQAGREPYLAQRYSYYLARTCAAQLEVGDLYSKLAPTIVIMFLASEYYDTADEDYHLCRTMREVKDRAPPDGLLVVHTIEIPKLIQHVKSAPQGHRQNPLELWGQFLYNPEDPELERDDMNVPAIKDVIKRLEDLSGDAETREIARMRENALRRYHTDLAVALAEGEAKGRAEGRAEGEAKGRAEGEAKGRAEGEAHARISLLQNLLAHPDTACLTPEVLAQMTGLIADEVKIELEKRRKK